MKFYKGEDELLAELDAKNPMSAVVVNGITSGDYDGTAQPRVLIGYKMGRQEIGFYEITFDDDETRRAREINGCWYAPIRAAKVIDGPADRKAVLQEAAKYVVMLPFRMGGRRDGTYFVLANDWTERNSVGVYQLPVLTGPMHRRSNRGSTPNRSRESAGSGAV
jgi:hypothetical protein